MKYKILEVFFFFANEPEHWKCNVCVSACVCVGVCLCLSKTAIIHMDCRPFGCYIIQFMAISGTLSPPRILPAYRLSFLILGVWRMCGMALTEFKIETLNTFFPTTFWTCCPILSQSNNLDLRASDTEKNAQRTKQNKKRILYTQWQLVKL